MVLNFGQENVYAKRIGAGPLHTPYEEYSAHALRRIRKLMRGFRASRVWGSGRGALCGRLGRCSSKSWRGRR